MITCANTWDSDGCKVADQLSHMHRALEREIYYIIYINILPSPYLDIYDVY